MSFENRGKGRRPDIRMTVKNKESGHTFTLGAAWIDDGETRPSLRIDKDVAGIFVVTRGDVLDRLMRSADKGSGVAAHVLENLVTTGKDGAHYINVYLNWLEEQRSSQRQPEPDDIPADDFADDFADEFAGL